METITIGIIDDQNLFVRSIKRLLDDCLELRVVLTAETGNEFLSKIRKGVFPDVIIVGVNRPRQYEPGSLKTLIKGFTNCKTIALNALKEKKYISEIILSGIQGCISKSAEPDELIEAIKAVKEGGMPFDKESLSILRNQYSQKKDKSEKRNESDSTFTSKEIEIIKLVCQEFTNVDICKKFGVSKKTVEAYKRSIILKMGVRNSVGIAVYATRYDLISR